MKLKTLLPVFSILLFSCSTAYRTGQTPDDLYAARGRIVADVSDEVKRDDSPEDNEIRMAARDPRWRTIDDDYDYGYDYNPYLYGYNYGYYYNPYYYPYPVYSDYLPPVDAKNTTIRSTNLNTYNNAITTLTPVKGNTSLHTITVVGYYTQNTGNRNSIDYNTRTYNPLNNNNSGSNGTNNNSSNSSGNTNSNSATGTGVSRAGRGG